MKDLIGNTFKIFFKENEKNLEGLLIDSNEKYDYIQSEKSVFIVPKNNILYYETYELYKSVKVLGEESKENINDDKTISIFIDQFEVAELKVSGNMEASEIIKLAYLEENVKTNLKGKVQKSIECFDNAIYIITGDYKEKPVNNKLDSFSIDDKNPTNTFLSPMEMVSRLEKTSKRG